MYYKQCLIWYRLGVLLCEALFFSHVDKDVFEMQLLVINVLMFMPDTFCVFLTASNGIVPLLEILEKQMDMVTDKMAAPGEITPTIIVLNKMAMTHPAARAEIKALIFQNDVACM